MKKRFLFVVGLLFCLIFNSQFSILNSQQLPNSSFDQFEDDIFNFGSEEAASKQDGKKPVGWNSSNLKKTAVGMDIYGSMVYPDDNGRSGKCVRCINTSVGYEV